MNKIFTCLRLLSLQQGKNWRPEGSTRTLLCFVWMMSLLLLEPNLIYAQSLGTGPNNYHSSAVSAEGKTYTWGGNSFYQLGNNTNVSASTPQDISSLGALVGKQIVNVANGFGHTLALAADGTVYAWGYNASGQVGNGSNETARIPVQVSNLKGIKAISAGSSHSVALGTDGTVYTWGEGSDGELGNGATQDSNIPVRVSTLSGVKAIAAGSRHTLALGADNRVYAWGDGLQGQLGTGTYYFYMNPSGSATPVPVINLTGVKAIAAGSYHSLAIGSDDRVYAWGSGASGQLGTGTFFTDYQRPRGMEAPVQVLNLTGIKMIAAGGAHSLAIGTDGTAYAWGYGLNGQLGNGVYENVAVPVRVLKLTGVKSIAGGQYQSYAINGDNQIYAWGYGREGQIGNGVFYDDPSGPAVPELILLQNTACSAPKPAFTTSSACAETPISFTNATTNAAPDAIYAWDMNNDGITDFSSSSSPSYTYSKPGTYTAKLTVTQGTCSASFSQQITVLPLAVINLVSSDADNAICAGESVTFTASTGGTSYSFALNGKVVQSGPDATYTTSALADGDKVKVTLTNANSCTASSAEIVTTVASCRSPSFRTANNCTATGTILREQWNNITGTLISTIPVNTTPSTTSQLTSFEAPTNTADNFGSRIRGYICVPQTGSYTFYISGDDNGELWLSTDEQPANKKKIASFSGWTNLREWTKYASQKSAAIVLEPGRRYYIEALHKEGTRGDNLAVAWRLPTGTLEAPIAGTRLSPFVPPMTNACTATGSILQEQWNNISGSAITAIPLSNTPTSTHQLTSFEAPTNTADNYGSRIRGYICAPTTGSYTFYIAGDDNTELWLSTDEQPANKKKIAYSSGWTKSKEWTKYASQKSAVITLQANTKYYIEALHKEGTGGDNLAVGWLAPGSTSITVIPGAVLSPVEVLANKLQSNQTQTSMVEVGLPIGQVFRSSPNPFRERTNIEFAFDQDEEFNLLIYNVNGALVKKLKSGKARANTLVQVDWTDYNLPAGFYMIRLETKRGTQTLRIVRQ